jgi:hypothetical protein
MFPAAKTQYVDHWQISLSVFGFLWLTQLLLPQRRIGELSNKAITDFDIAKTPVAFPSFFLL